MSSKYGIVIWNQLGSDSQVQISNIGVGGTVNGTPSYSAVQFDNGMDTTTANYAEWTDLIHNNPSLRDKGCIEMWVKHTISAAGQTRNYALFSDNVGWLTIRWEGGQDISNTYEFYIYDGANRFCPSSEQSFGVNDIQHIAAVWDNGGIDGGADRMRIYIDGASDGNNTTFGTTIADTVDDMTIGMQQSGNSMACKIENVKIFNYAKTDFRDRTSKTFTYMRQVSI